MVGPTTAAAVVVDDEGVGATVVGAGVAETADVVANASAETKDNNDVNNNTVKTGANAAVRSFQLLYHFPLVVAIVLIFLISRALDGRIPKSVVCLGTRSVHRSMLSFWCHGWVCRRRDLCLTAVIDRSAINQKFPMEGIRIGLIRMNLIALLQAVLVLRRYCRYHGLK